MHISNSKYKRVPAHTNVAYLLLLTRSYRPKNAISSLVRPFSGHWTDQLNQKRCSLAEHFAVSKQKLPNFRHPQKPIFLPQTNPALSTSTFCFLASLTVGSWNKNFIGIFGSNLLVMISCVFLRPVSCSFGYGFRNLYPLRKLDVKVVSDSEN